MGKDAPYCLYCNITNTPSQIGNDEWKDFYKGPSGQSAGIKTDGTLWQWGSLFWDNHAQLPNPVQSRK